jgi:hypothetical protein
MGHPVREEEIELAREEKEQLKKYLGDTPLKMDSVRLILAMT